MTYTFRTAVRERTPLLIGLVGASGSGKTFSALRLATGIQSVSGGKVFAIDTEARRMLHYAGKFSFEHLDFKPPFGSLNYRDAIKDAIAAGAKTVIIDSMSHEHEGEGAYLELHESELQRMAGDDFAKRNKMNFAAWIKPSGNRRKLINFMLQADCNFIFCFRAKEKLKIERGKDPVELGWQAIAGDEFVYEMLIRCLLLPGARGKPDWSEQSMSLGVPKLADGIEKIFPRGAVLDESMGAQLAKWAAGVQAVDQKADGATDAATTAHTGEVISPDQVAELEMLCQDAGLTIDQFKKAAKVERIAMIAPEDFPRAKVWIAKHKQAATAAA